MLGVRKNSNPIAEYEYPVKKKKEQTKGK